MNAPGYTLTHDAAEAVAGAVRFARRTSREARNNTPTPSMGAPVGHDMTWPVRVTGSAITVDVGTGEETFGSSGSSNVKLYPAVWLQVNEIGTAFEEREPIWVLPVDGAELQHQDVLLCRLGGVRELDGVPIYVGTKGSSCTAYRPRCLNGALILEECVNGEWVFHSALGTCDPRSPASSGSSGGSGSGGSGEPPIDEQPGAAPVRFPFVRRVCPGATVCQTFSDTTPDKTIDPDTWLVKIIADADFYVTLPPWEPGLAFRIIRISGSGETGAVPQSGETINGAGEALLGASTYSAVEIEADCEEGVWFAFNFNNG